jgi:beta-1,4-mannosyl-glycoprotein beta-1,4-N-acetylglucosaminyltransferase
MIYDMFSFFNELDVLEERLSYLYDKIDYFIICESNYTHTGNKKSLNYSDNINRYKKYQNKIIHLVYDGQYKINNPWINENEQRNYILSQFNFKDDDKLLISDVDEIPSYQFIDKLSNYNGNNILIAVQELSFFWPNYRRNDLPYWIGGTRGFNFKHLKNLRNLNKKYTNTFLKSSNQGVTLTKIRLTNIGIPICNGGWHLSYMGGRDSIKLKIKSFAHNEESERIGINIDQHINEFIDKGKNFFGSKEFYLTQGSFNPKYLISENKHNFKMNFVLHTKWLFYKYELILKIKIKYYVRVFL